MANFVVISLVLTGPKLQGRHASISGRLSYFNNDNLRAGAFWRETSMRRLIEIRKVALNFMILSALPAQMQSHFCRSCVACKLQSRDKSDVWSPTSVISRD